ncbi:hypothetical protein [Aquibacillus albus]|uniref:Spo0E family sporulation regulatory protein-aspartic acid phosphatase n=1 Tax=Aquibacillus albus TaxID=1168171 RepID=A0ABS2MXM1_9BACI|nr:hypothetical protein [Aquibacillus albus]MBM7570435.1 hypothetical protein [Aquibacillus albus]
MDFNFDKNDKEKLLLILTKAYEKGYNGATLQELMLDMQSQLQKIVKM